MKEFSFLESKSFWSTVVLVISAVFTSLFVQYPNVGWIGTVVSVLSFLSANFFHKQEVLQAAAKQ